MAAETVARNRIRAHLGVRAHETGDENELMLFLQQFPDVTVENIE